MAELVPCKIDYQMVCPMRQSIMIDRDSVLKKGVGGAEFHPKRLMGRKDLIEAPKLQMLIVCVPSVMGLLPWRQGAHWVY